VRLDARIERIGAFLGFLEQARLELRRNRVSERSETVTRIRAAVEEHYVDDQNRPAMYQKFESAFYDDAPAFATLWPFFRRYELDDLRRFEHLLGMELAGLTGDRHPRSIFARSPFGVAALVVGTLSVWWAVIKTVSDEDMMSVFLSDLVLANAWVTGGAWIVGMFVVLWYILKTARNRAQVASLSSINRALALYLEMPEEERDVS
jgi:hypothetical protein